MANEDIPNLTAQQKLTEAKNVLFLLVVRQKAVTSNSADGVSISRNISELRSYISELTEQVSQESGSSLQWEIRKTLEI